MNVVFLDAETLPRPLKFSAGVSFVEYAQTLPDQTAQRIHDADIVITNKVVLNRELIAGAPRLGQILVAAAGTDIIDKEAAAARNIPVRNVPDYGSFAVAEHVIATLFALRRHLLEYANAAIDGRWSAATQFCWHGPHIRDVRGSTLGIVGRGRIGEAVAELARGLGVNVLFAASERRAQAADELPVQALLSRVDALSLHMPLTPQTKHFINAQTLSLMKPAAVLINTGRGALIDADALISTLKQGKLAGAAIDVLDREPPPRDHVLLAADIPNLIVTPHVAWASEQAQENLAAKLEAMVEASLTA
ncbi:MAG TPA: NAD(P)-dependent oxidoreductase [Rhodocyclaceae bacterium]|nr:NAD(P)-dependent oxidoreductase [Rhodocyclaceae bacterium]